MLLFDWLVEALHLAHMISHLGYIYPVDKAQLGQPIKDDGTLYRLQVALDASCSAIGYHLLLLSRQPSTGHHKPLVTWNFDMVQYFVFSSR